MSQGRTVWFSWRGRRVAAFVPDRLEGRLFSLSPRTAGKVHLAGAACAAYGDRMAGEPAQRRRLLAQEAVASSVIEDVAASVEEVLAATAAGSTAAGPIGLVAANLAMLEQALAGDELSVSALMAWHRTLLAGAGPDGAGHGRLRSEPGWIGGHSPLDAAVVLPPPELVEGLLDDLVDFVNDSAADAVTVAAVAHAQFEVIHPFGDGNGRIGRALASRILAQRLRLAIPPPLSRSILAARGGYIAGLTSYRVGRWDDWVGWRPTEWWALR